MSVMICTDFISVLNLIEELSTKQNELQDELRKSYFINKEPLELDNNDVDIIDKLKDLMYTKMHFNTYIHYSKEAMLYDIEVDNIDEIDTDSLQNSIEIDYFNILHMNSVIIVILSDLISQSIKMDNSIIKKLQFIKNYSNAIQTELDLFYKGFSRYINELEKSKHIIEDEFNMYNVSCFGCQENTNIKELHDYNCIFHGNQ